MPELPEVETIKRDLEKIILGKRIKEVRVHNPVVIREPSAGKFKKGIEGQTVKAIRRRAKVLIVELSGGQYLVIHLKMTGQLVYPGGGDKSRVEFVFSDGTSLDFNDQRLFAELRLLEDWEQLKFIRELGPEPLEMTKNEFFSRLGSRKTRIKPFLMDQTVISGIGNIYAAEVLFRAKIDPARAANSLSGKEKESLYDQIRQVLREAIKAGGSSIDDYVRLSGEKGDFVRHHRVYGRESKPCPACRTPIKRIVLGGRGTFFCPECQR